MKERTPRDKLTAQRAHELFRYDRDTGVVTRRVGAWVGKARNIPCPRATAGTVVGTLANGYLTVSVDGVRYRLHRVIWLMTRGRWPDHVIDHINGVKHDNRYCNLREATPAQNSQNSAPQAASAHSALKGVSRKGNGRWLAQIRIDGRRKHLGYFSTPEDAHAAYCEAARRFHGKFARTN